MIINKHSIEAHREQYLRGLEFNEAILNYQQKGAWLNHPRYECFVCMTKSNLDTITELKLQGGWKLIDEPLAKGTYPNGRYYQYLLKSEAVLQKEQAELYESVREKYLQDLEEQSTKGLDRWIETVLHFKEQNTGGVQ